MATEQFIRKCTLIVSDINGEGLDLSKLRIKFNIKRSDTQTPNIGEFRIYNLERKTALRIQKEFSNVIFQAGYESNFGVIFSGNVKQIYMGRETGTETYLDIICGDGDLSYNYAVVNSTIAAGAGQVEQINAAVGSMTQVGGTTKGNIGEFSDVKLPRGKVLYGMARNYLKQVAKNSEKTWSIQDGKVQFVPVSSYLPGEVVVLTSKTGMIGTPVQTNEGVNIKCLINPKIRIGTRIKVDNESVANLKIDLSKALSPANIPAPFTDDGVYYVLTIEHQGDNRGTEWYSNLTTLNIDVTTNPINSVQVGQ